MLWKAEKRERKLNYRCDACQAYGWHERRACYLESWPGEERHDFQIPVFDDTTHPPRETGIANLRDLTVEQVLEKIDELALVFPDMPPFELVQLYFKQPKELCLTSIAEPDIVSMIELESACEKYQTLPYAGGLQDQPTIVLEAFSAIREAENEFNVKRMGDMNKSRVSNPPSPQGPMLPGRPTK